MSWILTYTGKKINPFVPDLNEICIEDIAHALSLQCRFGGHCKQFYSVADHCIRVSELVKEWIEHSNNAHIIDEDLKKQSIKSVQQIALLHDATEAYIMDIPTPVKLQLDQYKRVEKNLEASIYKKFNSSVLPEIKDIIKWADYIMLINEAQNLFAHNIDDWEDVNHARRSDLYPNPASVDYDGLYLGKPRTSEETEKDFLKLFTETLN